ncbi:MAG: PEGA domain-containing protein [Candidatus Cloacimonadota bacterium]
MKVRYLALAFVALWAGMLNAQNMFGAFKIETSPQGADVIITASNQFIGRTPTQAIPVMMDQFMTYYYGTPGRAFNLVIRKDGFRPLQQTIFVPFTRAHQADALRHPTVFNYRLERLPAHNPGHGGNHGGGHPGGGHHPGYSQQNDRQVRIITEPRGAEIYVNDQYVGTSPLSIDLKRVIRPNQRITIRAEKRGYRPAETILRPGQDRIRLELRRRRRS